MCVKKKKRVYQNIKTFPMFVGTTHGESTIQAVTYIYDIFKNKYMSGFLSVLNS